LRGHQRLSASDEGAGDALSVIDSDMEGDDASPDDDADDANPGRRRDD
jgi:hypothetical protein